MSKPMTEKSTQDTMSPESAVYAVSAAAAGVGNGLRRGAKLTPGMAPVTAPAA